jgi:hypothetical protein
VLTRIVPREAVEEVLAETGRKEQPSRLLPAHFVVYFVLAMAIFSDGYEEGVRRLVGGLEAMRAWRKEWSVPATGGISQAGRSDTASQSRSPLWSRRCLEQWADVYGAEHNRDIIGDARRTAHNLERDAGAKRPQCAAALKMTAAW